MILKYNNRVVTHNDRWIDYENLNPLNLPPYTLRLLYKDNTTPTFAIGTGVQVSSSPNVWDLTYNGPWTNLLARHTNLLEILGANSKGITNMYSLCNECSSLINVALFDTSDVLYFNQMLRGTAITSVPLFNTSNAKQMNYMFSLCYNLISVPVFDTSNVVNTQGMFIHCTSLTEVPYFNMTKVTTMPYMFESCVNVEGGALALYQQASNKAILVTHAADAFKDCGINTTTGAAELAQIPDYWK